MAGAALLLCGVPPKSHGVDDRSPGQAPAALSLKTSNDSTDLGFFDGFLTCSPEAAVTSTLTSAELPDSPEVRRP